MELALEQIAWHLRDELPLELDKIAHARGDDVVLPHPDRVEAAIFTVDQYPAIFVMPARSTPQVLTSGGLIADHVVHIEVFLAEHDTVVLQKQRLRYLAAIKRVMLRTHDMQLTNAQTAYSCEWLEDDYGDGLPVRDGDTGQTIDSVAVRFMLQSDEA